ncbi:MAG: 3-hydroxyanthranilate 3,4-dioxygenase [Oligoflexia bacterium]|nr:3-hydroxyanthranilate 3,4-dioxygenase [Oligoflexia bacterium]
MSKFQPFNFKKWIDDHRDLLKPPVGNKCVFKDSTFIVMVVGGPNARTDFHVNQTDEFFYQLEGNMHLKVINDEGKFQDVHINEGDIYMLPAGTPHSPQRPANTVGLVVEKTREKDEQDGLQWYCEKCTTKLYEEYFHLENIETQFGAVFERYYNSEHTKCTNCGHVNGRTWE